MQSLSEFLVLSLIFLIHFFYLSREQDTISLNSLNKKKIASYSRRYCYFIVNSIKWLYIAEKLYRFVEKAE